jgi:Cytochrome c7 and related cytochrome c
MKRAKHSNILLKALFVLIALTVFAASCFQKAERINPTITSSETPVPPATKISDTTFEAFSHKVPEHKQFECNSCHQREGGSLKMEFAGHDSCIGCHLNQFTNPQRAMCAICHEDLQSVRPSTRKFPTKFREGFNMKFDHGDHDSGAGRPPAGCASCHQSAGAGKTIPIGFQAHNNCYTCHTAESKIGSCNVCHQLAPYSRTPQSRYVFRAVFSHNEHSGVGCNECHTVNAGARQGRQVSNIAAAQHNCGSSNNCNSCHDGSRAFSGNDVLNMSSCVRCHTGSGFDMLPGGPCRN